MIRLKVYGYLTDVLGWFEKNIEKLSNRATVAAILQLAVSDEGFHRWLAEQIQKGSVIILVNGIKADLDEHLKDEDEVALIPLPSGG